MPLSLNDLTDPAAVQAALDEFERLGQQAFLAQHGFRRASGYVVRNPRTGNWADSKAITGVALAYQYPGSGGLKASEFSGGVATGMRRLEALHFEVEALAAVAGQAWQADEVELVVADYLAMLMCELASQPYNKAEHRRRLMAMLPARSAGSIEFKRANISAALLEMGFPYIKGYQPRSNFERHLLMGVLGRAVAAHAELDKLVLHAVEQPAVQALRPDFARVRAEAPLRDLAANEPTPAYLRTPVHRDYFEREARNRTLGREGELFALDFERWRLTQLGLGRLAEQVRHVSALDGDGAGHDIRSFEHDGRERFIEVKTTGFGERTPFFVSANEVSFAKAHADRFHLYRLFDFRAAPRLFELQGPIETHCLLDATTYRASFG